MLSLAVVSALAFATSDWWTNAKDHGKQEDIVLLHGHGCNLAMRKLASRVSETGYGLRQIGYRSINSTL